jgi:hypothetical protein
MATDTHFYDGKINHNIGVRTPEERTVIIDNLLDLYISNQIPIHNNFRTIVRDMNTSANYDSSNNYHAEDILCHIAEFILDKANEEQRKDIIVNLNIQFEEMSSGMCPQGRTHRLYQVYYSLP